MKQFATAMEWKEEKKEEEPFEKCAAGGRIFVVCIHI